MKAQKIAIVILVVVGVVVTFGLWALALSVNEKSLAQGYMNLSDGAEVTILGAPTIEVNIVNDKNQNSRESCLVSVDTAERLCTVEFLRTTWTAKGFVAPGKYRFEGEQAYVHFGSGFSGYGDKVEKGSLSGWTFPLVVSFVLVLFGVLAYLYLSKLEKRK